MYFVQTKNSSPSFSAVLGSRPRNDYAPIYIHTDWQRKNQKEGNTRVDQQSCLNCVRVNLHCSLERNYGA